MSVEASIESIDALHEEDRLEAALAMADDALGQHPGDAGLLLRKARLLGALDRGDEAMDMYERQRAALLATRPRTPHHWQEAGFSLYEQAHLARRLGRGPESRALILEAVARLGSIALPAAWYEAADWAWEDGEHDVAGRLYHDAMFKAGECFDRQIQPIVERLRSLGEEHSHHWVWTALMRASLPEADDPDQQSHARAIAAMYERTGGLPAALRIRARVREYAGDLEGAAADLDAYMAQVPDPRAQVWRVLLDYKMGQPVDLEGIRWTEHRNLGGGDYYSAGCEFAEVVELLKEREGLYTNTIDLARVSAVEAEAYELGAARFEHYFATGEGGPLDAEPHIYAMLCNNLAINGYYRQERFAEAIPWHEKGWAVSPFWEQYHGRLSCQTRSGQWAGAVESWKVLNHTFGSQWPAEQLADEVAWAYDQLEQPAQVLEVLAHCNAQANTPLQELIADIPAETRRVALMALAAKAAAKLGQRPRVEQITRELLASDRLSDGLCQHLAQAWRLLGDEAQAERCAQALNTPAAEQPALPDGHAPDVATMLGWTELLALNDGYAVLRLQPEASGWQFELRKNGESEIGNQPIYVQIRQGNHETDGDSPAPVPTWHLGVLSEQPGIFGRLRGKGSSQRLCLAHSPTGHAPPAEWKDIPLAQLPPVWPELQRRVAEANAAWQQLTGSITVERIVATIEKLHSLGVDHSRDINLGTCRIGPNINDAGATWVSLTIDRKLDTDPTLPDLAYDPYHFIYQVVPATDSTAAYPIYGLQDGAGSGRHIEPGDAALARAASQLFERAIKRLDRWARAAAQ